MMPTMMKLPLASWRTSSHSSEHWRSGRILVGVMFVFPKNLSGEHFGGANGIAHQKRNRHWPNAARIRREFSGNFFDGSEINVAHQPRTAFGRRIGDAIHAHVNDSRA